LRQQARIDQVAIGQEDVVGQRVDLLIKGSLASARLEATSAAEGWFSPATRSRLLLLQRALQFMLQALRVVQQRLHLLQRLPEIVHGHGHHRPARFARRQRRQRTRHRQLQQLLHVTLGGIRTIGGLGQPCQVQQHGLVIGQRTEVGLGGQRFLVEAAGLQGPHRVEEIPRRAASEPACCMASR
jgi:hypothetical protein